MYSTYCTVLCIYAWTGRICIILLDPHNFAGSASFCRIHIILQKLHWFSGSASFCFFSRSASFCWIRIILSYPHQFIRIHIILPDYYNCQIWDWQLLQTIWHSIMSSASHFMSSASHIMSSASHIMATLHFESVAVGQTLVSIFKCQQTPWYIVALSIRASIILQAHLYSILQ